MGAHNDKDARNNNGGNNRGGIGNGNTYDDGNNNGNVGTGNAKDKQTIHAYATNEPTNNRLPTN